MVDFIKAIATLENSIFEQEEMQESIQIGKLNLIAIKDPKTFEIIRYVCKVKNLHFVAFGDKLTVTNSLHKFYKDNNYSDFYFSELKKSITGIENLTGISSELFEVKKLEFGLNIETEKPPLQYLELFTNLENVEYDKMRSKKRWYGNKYQRSEYSIKIYDKGVETNRNYKTIETNLFRFEIAYSRKRKIPSVLFLSDLKDKNNLDTIFKEFTGVLNKIYCIDEVNFSSISSRDREMYFAGKSKEFWMIEKSLNTNTTKDKKKRYKKIQSAVISKNLMEEFIQKLNNKYNLLISM